jgi:hypothetical protein
VIVVSEETATISVVLGGEMIRGLDAPRLRVVLTEVLSGERSDLKQGVETPRPIESETARRASEAEGAKRAGEGESAPRARSGTAG